MPGLTLDISPKSKRHTRLKNALRTRIRFSSDKMNDLHEKWRRAEETALAFMPERDVDALRRAQRDRGKPQYTTLQIPYSYGLLMAAHTWITTVFLSRDPVFQYQARHGEPQNQVFAIEALMSYQLLVGEMLAPLYVWIHDALKYGVAISGLFWEDRSELIAEIQNEEQTIFGVSTGKFKKRKVTRRVRGYSGNRNYNVRPFDFFPDPRVPISEFQRGEFCGVYVELPWNDILRRQDSGLYTNLDKLKDLRVVRDREQGSSALELPTEDPLEDTLHSLSARDRGQVLQGKDVVALYEVHVDLVPADWDLGSSQLPEKWVFTITKDFDLLIGAQPLGALHNKYPFNVMELEPEGYGLGGRGIPEINKDIQHVIDWLVNSHFYNVRKALNDQFVVDPSKVMMKDVLDPLPGNLIRLKPEAYGTDPALAIKQLQVVDVTQTHLRDTQFMIEMAQRALGINDNIMGLINAGGSSRKTAAEVRTSSSFGASRLKTIAEYFSAVGWTPMSQMLLQNSQQYYDQEFKLRLVGDQAILAGPKFLQVDPESIQGFYDFVPVDGTLPVDRFAQAALWREMLGQLRNFPEIMAQYDMSRIFAWVARLAGLNNIDQFRVDLVGQGTLDAQAQQGNVVPIGGREDLARTPEPGQISGLGTTG